MITDISELSSDLWRRPGLVVGPGVTTYPTLEEQIYADIQRKFSITSEQGNYFRLLDYLRQQNPELYEEVCAFVKSEISRAVPSSLIKYLTRVTWSVIASLTPDMALEEALKEEYDKKASSWTITVVDNEGVIPPIKTLPIYKLLGSINHSNPRHQLALTQSDLTIRQSSWASLLRTLPDNCKAAPLLFLGTETCPELVEKFFGAMYVLGPPFPKALYFLKGDKTLENPVLTSLVSGRSVVHEVNATLKDFVEFMASAEISTSQLKLPLSSRTLPKHLELQKDLKDFKSLVDVIPSEIDSGFDIAAHKRRVIDALFMPAAVDWIPFLANFDLLRTDGHVLEQSIIKTIGLSDRKSLAAFVVRGEAGVGKTTLLKRLGVNLARRGNAVIWLKRPPLDSSASAYRALVRKLATLWKGREDEQAGEIVIICDQPIAMRLPLHELTTELSESGVPFVVVYSFRNSDYLNEEGIGSPLPIIPADEIELSYELDEHELAQLAGLMVKIEAAKDVADAERAIASVPTKNASDILCSLWYLVPETRGYLSASIEDEYCQLGNTARGIKSLADAAANAGAAARLAYECAAVCSSLEIGIPQEVLVHTLKISYDDWVTMCVSGRPLWGLLYEEEDEDTGNIVYYTRNEIVTQVLMRLLNSGSGHSGSVRRLKDLIGACSIGTMAYRSFLMDLLVRRRRRLEKVFSFVEGADLYALALNVFPEPDRTLEHHYGLWIKDSGRDPEGALKQLQKALDTPDYAHSLTQERPEHIHTSMAAAVVDKVREGSQKPDIALEEVKQHLRLAQSPTFFNPHTAHVFGRLLLELANSGIREQEPEIALESLSEAFPVIERTLQIIGASGRRNPKYARDLEMLTVLQRNLLGAVSEVHDIEDYAVKMFENNGSQVGFEVVARQKLLRAVDRDKGTDYNEANDYLLSCFKRIGNKGAKVSDILRATQIDLHVRWRLQKPSGRVDWELLRENLEVVLTSLRYQDDPLKQFYYGVALFHLGDTAQGNAVFSKLRRTLGSVMRKGAHRAYFSGKEGMPKRFQATLLSAHGRYYADISELGDILMPEGVQGRGTGATIHVYVVFTFNGPLATLTNPEQIGFELPK